MKYKIVWSGLADSQYWEYIAKFCVPSWTKLPGDKFVVHDSNLINIPGISVVDWESVVNRDANFLKLTDRLKPLNFWRKMQSQIWAVNNLKKDYDFLVLLDTDVEILDFNQDLFEQELENLKQSNYVWATGESQKKKLDAGHIIIDLSNPNLSKLFSHYENIWESGDIFKLEKWYDGHAVESMFPTFPSHKIKNTDYGSGMHLYEIGTVHWGSKLPKQLRREWTSDGKSLVEKRLQEIPVKQKKTKNG